MEDRKTALIYCAMCNLLLDEFFSNYPNPICRDCEKRTLNGGGQSARHDSLYDYGDNPVSIDGKKCWRRYKFGGYITMLDDYDCHDLDEFYERHKRSIDND